MPCLQFQQFIWLLLTFSLTSLVEISNQEIAQANYNYGGKTNDFMGSELTSQRLRDRYATPQEYRPYLKPTEQSFTRSIASSKQSNKQSAIKDDLQIMLFRRAWYKERTQEYPFRVIFQWRNEYELTIQSTEFGGTDKPEPIFPFFNFELQERGGKRFIVQSNGNGRESSTSIIHYRLEGKRLIIESGSMTVQYRGGKKEVNLRGEYTPWLSSNRKEKDT